MATRSGRGPGTGLRPTPQWRAAVAAWCAAALLAGQGLALWHALAHGGTPWAVAAAHVDDHGAAAAAGAAFGHDAGSACQLLDHLLGGAAAATAVAALAVRRLPGAPLPALPAGRCGFAAPAGFDARAPPAGA